MKDILNIELVQCHATKYILNDYISSCKTRVTKLKLLPLNVKSKKVYTLRLVATSLYYIESFTQSCHAYSYGNSIGCSTTLLSHFIGGNSLIFE